MVSSDKSADRNVSSEKLHKRLSSHSNIKVSQETYENKSDSSKPEGLRDTPTAVAKEEGQDSGATTDALLSDQEGSDCSSPLQKPLQSSNTVQCASDAQDSPSVIREKPSKPNVAEKEMQNSDATADALHSDKEGSSFSLPHEKPLQKPNTALRALQSGQESPSIIREKVSKDGYHWRKYGQKHVKGNEFIRSYYKCTHPNCPAKKQLEQSNNGQITDTVCIGQHNHPQVNITLPVDSAVTAVKDRTDKPSLVDGKDKACVEHAAVPNQVKPLEALPLSTVSTNIEVKAALLQSTRARDVVVTNEDPESKRLKKNNSNADVTGVEKSTGESRVVVQTSSEVDFVNDGYRWRKYGQKLVKGNPNPRSYYRCSNPGCPVKKHVERASHDHKIVITTYEGHHVHESLSGRTVTYNGAASTPMTNTNSDLRTKSTVNTVCAQTAESTCLDSEGRRNEQLTGDKTAKPKSNDMVESTSNEKEQNSNSCTERDSVNLDASCHTVSELPCKLDERQKDEDSDATTDALLLDQEGSDCSSPLQKPLQSSNTIQPALNVQDTPSVECEKVPKDNIAEKEMQDSDATPDALHSDKDGSTFSLSHEKPNTAPLALESGQDSPTIIREKVFKDGYHWRKYGQKHVKGNGFIRSYYRCTHPNCLAKKQLEQSNNGQITDIVCIGQHNHSQVNIILPVDSAVTAVKDRPDKLSLVNVADKASVEHAAVPHRVKPLEALPISTVSTMNEVKAALLQSTRKRDVVVTIEDPELKRLKKNNTNADVTGVEKSTGESCVVDQTSSEVDFVNDRQKLVKGNPNSRSYYRTSNPGCHVKKKVERISHDHKTVITTYEGHRDHESLFGRTVTHNGAASIPTTNTNSDSRTKSKANSVCAHTAESTCLDSQNRQNEQLTGDKIVKPKSNDIVESTSNEKEHNGNSCTEKDSVDLDTACHTGSELPCKIDEQQKDEVRIILEESKDGSKLNKQCTPDSDPIQN